MKKEAKEINQFANKRQIENLFRAFKDDNHAFKTPFKSTKCDPTKLKDYFYNHFLDKTNSIEPSELINVPAYINQLKSIAHKTINATPPKPEEIEATIKS